MAGVLFYQQFRRVRSAGGFVEVAGVVTASRIEGHRPARLLFAARYQVDGKSYTVNSSSGKPGSGLTDHEVVARFPVDSAVPVFYDPADPAEAIFTRQGSYAKALGLFALSLVGVAALLVRVLRR